MTDETSKSIRNHVDSLVAALGEDLGVPGLTLSEEAGCGLSFDEIDIDLAFERESATLFISTLLDELGAPLDRDALVRISDLNGVLFNHESSCISYDRESLKIFQSCRIAATSLSKERFLSWVSRSVNAIETTRDAVRNALVAPTDEPEETHWEPSFLKP